MKIDCHVHVTPPDITANWEKYAQKEPYFSLLSNSKVNKFANTEDVISMLDKENFDKAIIFGFAFCDIGLCRYVNDYVIESINKYPEKLTGFAVVPPGGKETTLEIERCHDAGLKGVGELFPAGQGINLNDNLQTQPITAVCKERSLPLLLHTNENVGRNYAGKTDVTMKEIENFITNNPDLKIILAHMGGGIFLFETMKDIKEKFRNVFYDTAALPFLYDERIYRAIHALNLCEKILFGSDFPIMSPSRYLDGLQKSGLTGEEMELVLGGNVRKLLGI